MVNGRKRTFAAPYRPTKILKLMLMMTTTTTRRRL
jgi:hypothetical protein